MLIRLLGDLLSPPRCAACEGPAPRHHVFCAGCASSVERCSAPPLASHLAASARRADASVCDVAFGYYGGALAHAIRRLKYEDRPYLARPLGELLRGACGAAGLRADAVLPIPLHPRRLVLRGYNQSALLAAHVAAELYVPLITSALARTVDTSPQVDLSGEDRQRNVTGAFAVTCPAAVEGRILAVVDDVSTTGATLGACRRALLAAGAQSVVGVLLARTPPSAAGIPLGLDSCAVLDIGVHAVRASSGCANVPMRANLRN